MKSVRKKVEIFRKVIKILTIYLTYVTFYRGILNYYGQLYKRNPVFHFLFLTGQNWFLYMIMFTMKKDFTLNRKRVYGL